MSTMIPEQPLSTGGVEPTPQNDSKTKKNFLTLPSRRTQSKQLSNRDQKVLNTDTAEETSPNINEIEKTLHDAGEIINFLIEHDNASKNGKTSPDKLLNNLLNECRGLGSEKMQKAVEKFDEVVGKFSENREKFLDSCVETGNRLSRTLLFGLGKIARDSYCATRDNQLNKDVRGPLFSATEDLIKLKLQNEDTQNMPIKTKLKYLALLSSIDRKKIEDFLKSDPGSRLLPPYPKKEKRAVEKAYQDFLQKLFESAYSQNVTGQSAEEKALAKMVYSNLILGRKFYEDGGREVLPIEKLPMVSRGQGKDFVKFLLEVRGAFKKDDSETFKIKDNTDETLKPTPNQEVLTTDDITSNDNEIPPFIYVNVSQDNKPPTWQYVSNEWNLSAKEAKIITEKFKLEEKEKSQRNTFENNRLAEINRQLIDIRPKLNISTEITDHGKLYGKLDDILGTAQLHVATKILPEAVKIEDAEMLGQITHDHAKDLKSQGFTHVQLLQTIYRYSTYSSTDKKTARDNILGKEPEIFKKAKNFGQLVIDTSNKRNEDNKNLPGEKKIAITPIFCGFCMGGMSAQSVGIACGYPSFTVNAFAKGNGIRKSIGEEKLKEANNDENALCNQAIYIAGDEISDEYASQNTLKNKRKARREEEARGENKTVKERINDSIVDIIDSTKSAEGAFAYNSRDGQTYVIDRLPTDVALRDSAKRHSSFVNAAKNIVLELLGQINQ